MKRHSQNVSLIVCFLFITVVLSQDNKTTISFEQLFPVQSHNRMGLNKLTYQEKEELKQHVIRLLLEVANLDNTLDSGTYSAVGGGHWISKNIDGGAMIILEDGSIWQVNPYDKLNTMLWLPVSNITVTNVKSGQNGYNYQLINTDDGETAHAKYLGSK